MTTSAKDWAGPNYLKDWAASRALANRIKEYYRFSKLYDKIDVRVVHNRTSNDYFIVSNIAELMESVTTAEEKVGL